MSDRTRNGRSFSQDALGFVFVLVGGFFAVSIGLFLGGQEPKPGLVSALTWPVVELVSLLGFVAGFAFSAGLAVLGTLLFLRPTHLAALRPLLALLLGAVGSALVLGAFGSGGGIGAWLPGLVSGFVGNVLGIVLGLALTWLGWALLFPSRAPGSTPIEVLRVGLAARQDAAAGVSPAEAALLVSEARAPAARPAPRRDLGIPLRDETIRPYTPAAIQDEPAPRREAAIPRPTAAVPVGPAKETAEAILDAIEPSVSVLPAPSWEETTEEADEKGVQAEAWTPVATEERAEEERLSEALIEEFETEDSKEKEEAAEDAEEEKDAEDAEGEGVRAEEVVPPTKASWEQIGLFDEEEEVLEQEARPSRPVELTPSFDFDAAAPTMPAVPSHEPEPAAEEPAVEAAALAESLAETRAEWAAPNEIVQPAPEAAPAPRPEPTVRRDEGGESWEKLVYEAGCVILEQKRVAVSMIERRFAVDFDKACRVLDELQQAGLIGPYIGGRTRDILLTREEWLPHAPHAS